MYALNRYIYDLIEQFDWFLDRLTLVIIRMIEKLNGI